jgi:sulfur relay (sulfurtransferase) DsrC/TusE family protein
MLTLYFNYNDKEFYIDIDKSSTVKQIIKDLSKKYGIKKNSSLYMTEGNQFNRLDDKKKIKDFPNIKNETKLTILYNE